MYCLCNKQVLSCTLCFFFNFKFGCIIGLFTLQNTRLTSSMLPSSRTRFSAMLSKLIEFGSLFVTRKSGGFQTLCEIISFLDIFDNYRPQRSWAKVMFLQASVILLTGGVSASVHAGIHPPWEQTLPPKADTPWSRQPPKADTPPSRPPEADTPQTRHPRPDPPEADTHPPWDQTPPWIQSTSSRYASYWNAFLFIDFLVVPLLKQSTTYLVCTACFCM